MTSPPGEDNRTHKWVYHHGVLLGRKAVEKAFAEVTEGVKLYALGFAPRLSDSEVITMEIQ